MNHPATITNEGLEEEILKCDGITITQICLQLGITHSVYCLGRMQDRDKYNIIKNRLYYNLSKDLTPIDRKDIGKKVLAMLIVNDIEREKIEEKEQAEIAKNRESEIVFKG